MAKLILGSKSPRRREILGMHNIDFDAISPDIDENSVGGSTPSELVGNISREKVRTIYQKTNSSLPIITADTVVVCDGTVLGKPQDEQAAVKMLRMLSGRTHEVYTGITVGINGRTETAVECTRVFFRILRDEEISQYVASGDPLDKAGAYGIQGQASAFIERIEGDYYNVVGLPICRLSVLLSEKFGIKLSDLKRDTND